MLRSRNASPSQIISSVRRQFPKRRNHHFRPLHRVEESARASQPARTHRSTPVITDERIDAPPRNINRVAGVELASPQFKITGGSGFCLPKLRTVPIAPGKLRRPLAVSPVKASRLPRSTAVSTGASQTSTYSQSSVDQSAHAFRFAVRIPFGSFCRFSEGHRWATRRCQALPSRCFVSQQPR